MNLNQLEQKLIAAARRQPDDDRVPYAFEQRILARLRAVRPSDVWALWARALWRATMPCLVVALGCAAWALWHENPTTHVDDLAPDLDLALFDTSDKVAELW